MHRRRFLLSAPMLPWAASRAWSADTLGEVDLSNMPLGKLPPEFLTELRTGKGALGDWQVVEDPTARAGKAIAQINAVATDYRFPLVVYEPLPAQDVEASVRFKPVSGQGDRAGGLAVRLRDPNNYYVVRANALEDNVRLYRMVNGDRQQLAGASTKVASGVWHALMLRAKGDGLSVAFNGKPLFSHRDRTFTGLGKVALSTKADSVTRFDLLKVRPLT